LQIDWLTVAAQIVNFLVLIWLLQRFLYKPITRAMRRREERIEDRLAEAKSAREEVEEEARELQRRQDELEASKDEILQKARDEAEEFRERRGDEIREEMEERRETWRKHLAEEREAFVGSLQRQAGKHLLEITERILADYADTGVSERVVATFAEKLKSLDPDTREKMSEAAEKNDESALVHTGTAIDSAAKGRITRAIHDILSTRTDVDYREDHEMIFGARLTIGDYTVEWSALRYLKRLEAELGEIIDAGSRSTGRERDASQDEDHDDDQAEDRETA